MNEQSPNSRLRKPLRWERFDYRSPNTYFVTICTAKRRPLLSQVDETGRLILSPVGVCVTQAWLDLADRSSLELLAFMAMPDHVHGLLAIMPVQAPMTADPSLGRVIGAFKSTAWRTVSTNGLADSSFWQRGYHDRVVRSEDELRKIEWYIAENPARWAATRMVSTSL